MLSQVIWRPLLPLAMALVMHGAAVAVEPGALDGQAFAITIIADGPRRDERLWFESDGVHCQREDGYESVLPLDGVKARNQRIEFVANHASGSMVVGVVTGDSISGTMTGRGLDDGPGWTASFSGKRALPRFIAVEVLRQARDRQLQRQPKEAIPLFIQVIDAARDELTSAVPALMGLVESYQLLRGEPGIERQYAETVGRYLTVVPPLDGHSLPPEDQVREDLLWKSWLPGGGNRLVFTLSRVQRVKSIENGRAQSRLMVTLGHQVRGMSLVTWNPRQSEGMRPSANALVGRDPAGKEHQATQVNLAGWMEGPSICAWFDVPETVKAFTSLTGTVRVALAKDTVAHRVVLRRDATWAADAEEGRIRSLTEFRNGYELEFVITRSSAPSRLDGDGRVASDPAKAGIWSVRDEFTLFNARGRRLFWPSHRAEDWSGGPGMRHTFRLVPGDRPDALVHTEVTAVSVRDIPIVLGRVELP